MDLARVPCGGEPLRGCPEPVACIAFFPAAEPFAADAVLLCQRHALEYAGPGKGGAPRIVPLERLRPVGQVS